MPSDPDLQLRLAAFARLEELTRLRGGVVSDDDLNTGFEFRGERIKWKKQGAGYRLTEVRHPAA